MKLHKGESSLINLLRANRLSTPYRIQLLPMEMRRFHGTTMSIALSSSVALDCSNRPSTCIRAQENKVLLSLGKVFFENYSVPVALLSCQICWSLEVLYQNRRRLATDWLIYFYLHILPRVSYRQKSDRP